MRGRGVLFLVAGLYALGILAPAAVLAGILFASLERERVASAEKRELEWREGGHAVNEAVEAEVQRVREGPPVDLGFAYDRLLRRLWGPDAPDRGLVRLSAANSRGGVTILPFERGVDTGPSPEDALLITSSEYRAAALAERRGDHVEAAGRLRLALTRAGDAHEGIAVRLALARVLLAGERHDEAARVTSALDLTDASLHPRFRLRALGLAREVALARNARDRMTELKRIAIELLDSQAHRLGYFTWVTAMETWAVPTTRKSTGFGLDHVRELYQFLAEQRAELPALRDGTAIHWKNKYEDPWSIMILAASDPPGADGVPLSFLSPGHDLLDRALERGLGTYLARRDFSITQRSDRDMLLSVPIKVLEREQGIVDHAPVGETVWADPDSRLLLILAGLTLLGLLGGFGVTLWAVGKQARLARLRADFISSVSHELKTPLTSLLLFTDLLRTGRVTDPAKVGEYHDFMGEESAKLAHLVSNILDFARLEEGRKTYSFAPVEVREVLRHTAAMFAARAEAVGAKIECAGVPEGDLHLRADRDALERVLANLLDNAIKYGTKEGGAIELGAQRIGEEVRLTITDHGSGIPAAARRRVFTRFTRGDHHGPDAPPGSGLGLAIVAELVAAHDGRVAVADTEGGGTTVAVTLPRAAAPEQSPLQSGDPEEQA